VVSKIKWCIYTLSIIYKSIIKPHSVRRS